jgi:hypothetical protein
MHVRSLPARARGRPQSDEALSRRESNKNRTPSRRPIGG